MPTLMRAGLAIFGLAVVLDLGFHALSAQWGGGAHAAHEPSAGDAYWIHVTMFLGMAIILLGAIRARPRGRATEEWPGDGKRR